ncbi:MAG: glycosyltransferase family 9 protein [Verrucomicrobia bacterium]|jgi:heptosyltransferase II|nr:glycosyltransferase family 9 protein [Verrucomicrobiota bacterium]MBT7068243.1 glycosyltransferase family 9 protein [Verrucomicrobiota bacterium]MBT7699621.1 glycosyltransferase family 9 protein [Verrucomicrobiota bacterium]
MSRQHTVLIIKPGYSETFVPHVRAVCSLGDVLRTTPILHLFKDHHVTWLTDEAAVPLLQGNSRIDRLVTFGDLKVLEIEGERFDKVVNLEKVPELCGMADRIQAWKRYGFTLDPRTGKAAACEEAYESLVIRTHEDAQRLTRSWVELVYDMLGATWQGEGYLLGYQPKTSECYDIGFNVNVGTLCPLKAWPADCWDDLNARVAGKYRTSYQQCLQDLDGYMDWINSCRLLVTNDSLGLHLGLALGKQVLALFGPTTSSDLGHWDNLHIASSPTPCACRPCYATDCVLDETCMRGISPALIFEHVERILV